MISPMRTSVTVTTTAIMLSVLAATGCTGSSKSPTAQSASSQTSAIAQGSTIVATVTVHNDSRSYRLHLPAGEARARPLVVALHGGGGSGKQFEQTSNFDELSDQEGFVVAYGNGTSARPNIDLLKTWNAGDCCAFSMQEHVDDVSYISAVIDDVMTRTPIDPQRVYLVGHSNGAMMSLRVACELADRIAAIGVQSGALEISNCTPTSPVSVMQIHGTADRNLPYSGGVGEGYTEVSYNKPADAAKTFAQADGCAEPTDSTDTDNADITRTTYTECTKGTTVEFVTISGAAHPWMGHPSPRSTTGALALGEPYMKFDSTAEIWNFLKGQKKAP